MVLHGFASRNPKDLIFHQKPHNKTNNAHIRPTTQKTCQSSALICCINRLEQLYASTKNFCLFHSPMGPAHGHMGNAKGQMGQVWTSIDACGQPNPRPADYYLRPGDWLPKSIY